MMAPVEIEDEEEEEGEDEFVELLLVDDDGLGLNEIVNVPERDTESERREESDTEVGESVREDEESRRCCEEMDEVGSMTGLEDTIADETDGIVVVGGTVVGTVVGIVEGGTVVGGATEEIDEGGIVG
jgi:hypothetical protein